MNKGQQPEDESEMLDEYDFEAGERGNYAERYAERTNLVRLAPDLSEVFLVQSQSTKRSVST